MLAGTHALLVHDEETPLADLKPLLKSQGIDVLQARSCAEAKAALACAEPPAVIFTNTKLGDGTWADVEALAERECPAVPVIVVSRFVDLPLYIEALESGAADFMVPPFREADLGWVVDSALTDRSRTSSLLPRRGKGTRLEGGQHAQNHAASGAGAANA